MSFAIVDRFDLDLEGHKTIGFFLVPWVTFGCSIVRMTKKLWPCRELTDRQTERQTDIVKPTSPRPNFLERGDNIGLQ